jgi:SAM-dependent methyltransferase
MTTTKFKDLFSRQSADYARFRPTYPPVLFAWLAAQAPARRLAVDVGTGNGQAAVALAAHFERVIGVEPSAAQIASAARAPNVEYRQGGAEATGVDAGSADLLTSAQAFHWFKHDAFFAEALRVVRPGGALAVWCYGLASITPAVDAVVHELYEDLLGPYWDPERRMVEDGYRSVAFPFEELAAPSFAMHLSWSFEHLIGYLGTWSPRPRFEAERGQDALELVFPRLEQAWEGEGELPVVWPLSVRAFRL